MRGLVSLLLAASSSVLATIATIWMMPAAPVVRLAKWLSDRATALVAEPPTLNPEKTDEQD